MALLTLAPDDIITNIADADNMKNLIDIENRALEAFNERDYKRAKKVYYKLIGLSPKNPRYFIYLGECHRELGELQLAEKCKNRAKALTEATTSSHEFGANVPQVAPVTAHFGERYNEANKIDNPQTHVKLVKRIDTADTAKVGKSSQDEPVASLTAFAMRMAAEKKNRRKVVDEIVRRGIPLDTAEAIVNSVYQQASNKTLRGRGNSQNI